MNPLKAILLTAIIAAPNLAHSTDLKSIFGDRIFEDITLLVPSEYATIQDALFYLDDKEIASGAIVTIQVADGIYTDYSTVYITHPNGNRISIQGNIASPESAVIIFAPNQSGFFCDNGSHLLSLNGFTLKSNGTGQGVFARRNSSIDLGLSLRIEYFENAIQAIEGSTINAPGVWIKHNTGWAVYANASHISINSAIVDNNHTGVFGNALSSIQFTGGQCSNNSFGVQSSRGSYVQTSGTTYTNNMVNIIENYSGKVEFP